MDINKVKAGRYQLVVDRWDRPTSKPGEPFEFERYERGEEVELSQEDARRLVACGAAVPPGSIEKAEAEAAAARLKQLLARVPDEVRQQLIAELGEERAHQALTGADLPSPEPDKRPAAKRGAAPAGETSA